MASSNQTGGFSAFVGNISQQASATAAATPSKLPAPVPDPGLAPPQQLPAGGKLRVSPRHGAYLKTQANAILMNGGSPEDVNTFFDLEADKPFQGNSVLEQFGIFDEESLITTPGKIRGRAMQMMQGITFGFGDEVVGTMLAKLTGEGVRESISAYREELDAFGQEHGQQLRWEIAGSLLTGGLLVKGGAALATRLGLKAGAAVAPTLAQRAGLAVTTGGVAGAAFGAGHADPNTEDLGFKDMALTNISERAKSALFGAALGGAFGGVTVPVGRVAGTVARPLVRGATGFLGKIQNRIPGVGTPVAHAREFVRRALAQDGLTVEDALARVNNFEAAGNPMSLADIGGEAILDLAHKAVSLRSPAKQRLVENLLSRQAQQGERMTDRLFRGIFRNTKMGVQNAYHTEEALLQARGDLARPLYHKAFERTVRVTESMRNLLDDDAFRDAYLLGRNIAREEDLAKIGHGLAIPRLPTSTRAIARKSLEELNIPEPQIQAQLAKLKDDALTELPIRALDYMKQGLDVVIGRGLKEQNINSRIASSLRVRLNNMLAEVDAQVPEYGAARAIFSSASDMQRAVQLGRETFKSTANAEVIRQQLQKLSPPERDFFRLGSIQNIADRVHNSTANAPNIAKQFFGGKLWGGTSDHTKRIQALFGDAPAIADDVMRMIAGEARLSHSAERIARGAGRAAQNTEGILEGTVPGVRMSPLLTAASIGVRAINRVQLGFSQNVSDEIARMYSTGFANPNQLRAMLTGLLGAEQRLAQRSFTAGRLTVAQGQLTGTAAGAVNRNRNR